MTLMPMTDRNGQKEANKVSSQPKKLPATAKAAKNGSVVAPKKKEESSDSSDSDSSSDEEDVSVWTWTTISISLFWYSVGVEFPSFGK